jgi:putative MATE family efflux protein
MIGGAAQNLIALTDSIFLFHYDRSAFAAIGIAGVYYLTIAAICFSFSRGAQILIAQYYSRKDYQHTYTFFAGLMVFEVLLGLLLLYVLFFWTEPLFQFFIGTDEVRELALQYIRPRSYGLIFSCIGLSIMALYAGIARTSFILYDTIVLALVNLVLNYGLIFGKWGLPEMGIAGAGLASSIAEAAALIAFVIYLLADKRLIIRKYVFRYLPERSGLYKLLNISWPLVFQAVLGMGCWFIFFSIIENLGEKELARANLIRIIYFILSIPIWGYSAGINTIAGNLEGRRKRTAILPVVWRTSKVSLVNTLVVSLPVIIFPSFFLYPLLGGGDTNLLAQSGTLIWILLLVLICFSISSIYFNGILGLGLTKWCLVLQAGVTIVYLVCIYLIVNHTPGGLEVAWLMEIVYWVLMWIFSARKLRDWSRIKEVDG